MKVKDSWGVEHEAELVSREDSPYLVYEYTKVVRIKKYNPNYGDDRLCVCGHSYYRHFDSWEDMDAVGCKYCPCREFKEKVE